MNYEARELSVPLQLDVSELNDLRCLRGAEGYAELGMLRRGKRRNCKS